MKQRIKITRDASEKYSNATTWDQHSKEVNADMDALAHVLAAKHNHRITQLEKRVDKLEGK